MDWLEIRQEYETSDISLSELAEKYGLKYSTIKSRNQREKWQKNASKRDASKKKKDASKNNKRTQSVKQKAALEISPQLTEKQKLFCLYYIKTYNATMSAIKAGYSKDSAHVQGHDNLRNPKIVQEIKRLKGRALNELFIDAMDVLEAYAKIAFADISECVEFGHTEQFVYREGEKIIGPDGEYLTEQISYVNVKNHDEIDGSLISEVKQNREGISIKLHDKMKALEILTKYFDLLPDNHKRKIEEANLELSKRRANVAEEELELRKKESENKLF